MDQQEQAREALKKYFKIDKILPYHDPGTIFNFSGYIDFIEWDEITEPIMHGIDITGRYFLVMKMIIEGEKIMETFFQRYEDCQLFMGCGHVTPYLLIETIGGMTDNQFNLITDLLKDGKAVIYESHKPDKGSWIGKYVYIYDKEDILVR